jgi:hypothetical protein
MASPQRGNSADDSGVAIAATGAAEHSTFMDIKSYIQTFGWM